MRIMLLVAAAALSLGVGAHADNEGHANPQHPQINPESAQAPFPESAQAPVQNVPPGVPLTKGWRQDRQLVLIY